MHAHQKDQRRLVLSCLLTTLSLLLLLSACSGGSVTTHLQTHTLAARTRAVEWPQVDAAMGKAGSVMPGGVHRYSFPRTDLHVTVQGVLLKAGFALGGYVVFLPVGSGAMVMGDLVLTEDEINPVISRLEQGGIEQTALHNHLLFETPRVMYLHLGGQGDPVHLAQGIHSALLVTKTPMSTPAPGQPGPLNLDTKQLDALLGYHGKATNGVYQYSIPRAETITDGGVTIPPAMGVATVINFQPTGQGKAAITGDFVLLGKEVPQVIRALRAQGIDATALHSHMLSDSPHLFFLHFWANATATTLARGLRAALDQTTSLKAS
jgi:hypothetical protein